MPYCRSMGVFVLSLAVGFLQAAEPAVRIVTLGDSITKGARPGVKAEETFAALLQDSLRKKGVDAEVVNVGIGGERTDQALKRLAKDVIARKPALVTIMYGTNDSYVDKGKQESRLTVEAYEANLRQLLQELRGAGIRPVLMTAPRWGDKARNGKGENPNLPLENYVKVCRKVAGETKTPLVDHFEHWLKKEMAGTILGDWTTDQCHPNPLGHRQIAELMLPVVLEALMKK